MTEIWKPIIIEKNGVTYDYTGLYEVSNYGRVRSLKTGKVLKPRRSPRGYLNYALCTDGNAISFQAHRLVATMFIPNTQNKPFVNHIDEDPSNNVWTNLEWVTNKENMNHGTAQQRRSEARKGKHVAARKVICIETGEVFPTVKKACEWCGSIKVGACCRGEQHTAGGYHWEYYDDEWLAQAN